jgi:hypothetical protein
VRAAVVRAALVADPVLRAAHHQVPAGGAGGPGAAALGARDALAMLHGAACAREEEARAEGARAEREAAELWVGGDDDLVAMARRVVQLAGEVADGSAGAGEGDEWEAFETKEREAKRRWRVMKGLVAGVVVGSGVRWVDDQELVDLVLDEDGGG